MRGKSLPLAAIPLRCQRHKSDEEGGGGELRLIQAPAISQASRAPFSLPDGWIVEERPRPSSSRSYRHVDRYYYEPGTGKKFRSLLSVQRHLLEGTREPKRLKSENKNAAETKTRGSTLSCGLPDNWIVEEKPRKDVGIIDRTYIEPGTGRRFRSLLAAQRYLGEEYEFTATAKTLLKNGSDKQRASGENCFAGIAGDDEIYVRSLKHIVKSKNYKSHSPKKIGLDKDNKASMVDRPPEKVKWVLSGNGGFWTPFMNGSKVPESVKHKWSRAFVSYIQDEGAN